MNTIKVKYIGRKPFAVDNVAHSGKTWNGTDDVQDVTPSQAKRLIAYVDQWALEDADDLPLLDAPTIIQVEDRQGNTVEVDANDLTKLIEKMSATELAAYAKQKFGKTLARNKGRTLLLNEIIALENGATHV